MWHGRAVGRPFGFDGRNRPFSHRLLHVLEFSDGLIARENVWLHFAEGNLVNLIQGDSPPWKR